MSKLVIALMGILISCVAYSQVPQGKRDFPVPRIPFAPKRYVCYRTVGAIIVDGKLDEESWRKATWTDFFVDIEGDLKPVPLYKTRVKMLWDDEYFYVGAEIQEPNLWATLKQRDTVIFRDNDFEVFIDPNGSTQPYYEIEVNALSTVWDLLLREPYRDIDRAAINAWDIKGLKVGVSLQGTLNHPSDVDTGWTVEMAFPWDVLGEGALADSPPKDGAEWRINFSRVEWQTKVEDGIYVKETDSNNGQPLPECNWVWSPQGLIDMHYPEMWGFVQFSNKIVGTGGEEFRWNPIENGKWALRQVYYSERQFFIDHGSFTGDISKLKFGHEESSQFGSAVDIFVTPDMFEAIITEDKGRTLLHINQDGKTWESMVK